ncbi:MAG TPA: hypothetical protein VFS08_10595 [Gemmatimonadaceae bacterium]|nr:hypothetical protein [Gemmatimonadaceae bacterium]
MCQGLKSRPEPRATFDNALEGRSAPWLPLLTLIFAAVRAGQRREHVRELGRAILEITDQQYPPAPSPAAVSPLAVLLAEASIDSPTDVSQTRAAIEQTPEALEEAGRLSLRHAEQLEHTGHVLLYHAQQMRLRGVRSLGSARPRSPRTPRQVA